jgi:Zn-dependent M28 family amino/carboxypeptidase
MSSWMRCASALAMATLLATSACTPTQILDEVDTQALEALAQEISQERVWNNLLTLTDKHLQDSPVDCSTQRPRSVELFPELCHLTNSHSGEWVKGQLQSLDIPVHLDAEQRDGYSTTNIIAELRGTTHPEEIILVGAHYDAFYAGADDNSSGVAALLELARVLSQHRFARTIRFASFDLEEFGLVGSTRYVDTLAGEKLKTALIFDCIGYYSSEPGSQQSLPGLPSPSQGDFLAVIANDHSSPRASEVYALNNSLGLMKVVPIISPNDGTSPVGLPLMLSDHTPFWLTNQQAVFFTDTAPFRNPHYHKESDTADKLDPALLAQATRVAAVSIAYWAGGPQ